VQLCELFSIQSTCDEVFHIVNHESYASINGLKLTMDRNISSTQGLYQIWFPIINFSRIKRWFGSLCYLLVLHY
jgi:hypothetical protein